MPFLTTGPVYIEPKYRNDDNLFGLLITNLSGSSSNIKVEIFAAPFTSLNTPEPLTKIVDQDHTLPNDKLLNLAFTIPTNLPYYIFFLNSSQTVRPALYLLNNLGDAVQDFPLIPAGDWI